MYLVNVNECMIDAKKDISILSVMEKNQKNRKPEKIAVIILKVEQCGFVHSNVSKRCRRNGKQCRQLRSSVIIFPKS